MVALKAAMACPIASPAATNAVRVAQVGSDFRAVRLARVAGSGSSGGAGSSSFMAASMASPIAREAAINANMTVALPS